MQDFSVHTKTMDTNAGTLILQKAKVDWYLSINPENLPLAEKKKGSLLLELYPLRGRKLNLVKALQIYTL